MLVDGSETVTVFGMLTVTPLESYMLIVLHPANVEIIRITSIVFMPIPLCKPFSRSPSLPLKPAAVVLSL